MNPTTDDYTVRLPRQTQRTFALGLEMRHLGVVCAYIALTMVLLTVFGGQRLLLAVPPVVAVVTVLLYVGALAATLFIRSGGRRLIDWVPVVAAFGGQRASGQSAYVATPERVGDGPTPPEGQLALPGMLAGTELASLPVNDRTRELFTGREVGVLVRPATGAHTLVIEVSGKEGLQLSSQSDVNDLAGNFARLIAHASRTGSALHTLQILDYTVPLAADEVRAWYEQHSDPMASVAARSSVEVLYSDLGTGVRHRTFIALTADLRSTRDARAKTGGSVLDVLAAEALAVLPFLRDAGVEVESVLDPAALCSLLRYAYDPAGSAVLKAAGLVPSDMAVGPVAARNTWDVFEHEGLVSQTLFVVAWPHEPVRSTLLADLFATGSSIRRVALTIRPTSPEQARRRIRARRNADAATWAKKAQEGALFTAEERLQAEDAERLEADLAAGAGYAKWALYVTVTAANEHQCQLDAGAITRAAGARSIDLRPARGVQDTAFGWTLPVGTGI